MVKSLRTIALGILSVSVCAVTALAAASGEAGGRPIGFWTPRIPPRADYKIDCTISMANDAGIRGQETIRFVNTTSQAMQTLAINWVKMGNQTLAITADGESVKLPESPDSYPQDLVLPRPINPGQAVTLDVKFSLSAPAPAELPTDVSHDGWYPRLWWGYESQNNFEVKLDVPKDYTLATSGRFDPQSGTWRVEKAPSFGFWLGRNCEVMEAQAGDVPIRCLYRPDDKKCAQLLVDTAIDAIRFYRERFGFYPYPALAIVPGFDKPAGGYALGASIIVIHGMGRMKDKPQSHWQWITAHEIGHQYWGRYVMEKDDPGWLWIGMGIYADREYCRAKGITDEHHRGLMNRYIEGVKEGLDTTVWRSQEEVSQIKFDFNNVVIHGKGFSIISALDVTLGKPVFERICKRCLVEFAGRRMGLAEFQAVCEQESGQDLAWFFDQWVNSNKYLCYEIGSQKCEKKDAGYVTVVEVKRVGELKMPVPVRVDFEDGTSQQAFTNRLRDVDSLRFESHAAMSQVRLDPEKSLPLIVSPPASDPQQIARQIKDLPWVGAGQKALEAFTKAKEGKFSDSDGWLKLGLMLYDGKHYPESLDAFGLLERHARNDAQYVFVATVWQGHVFDLLGQRDKAVDCYQKALKMPRVDVMRHDQYHMRLDREWVQSRLKEPFRREE